MGKSKFKLDCEIVKNEELIPGIYKFTVKAKEMADIARAGQFLEIQVSDTKEVFLRRPISIYNIDKENGNLEFIFQVKGRGTEILSERKPGETINILGPLGNGFYKLNQYKNVAIIGGGIGVFPLYELTKELKGQANLKVYMGFRDKSLVTCEKEFEAIGLDKLVVTTDDGSYKEKGYAIDFMRKDIEEHRVDCIFGCGPLPMLRAVKALAEEMDIPCEISLEERMGCGIGACVGCNVRVKTDNPDEVQYRYVCTNGPIFEAKEVII